MLHLIGFFKIHYYVSEQGELLLLLDRFLYGIKQSPLKFQIHLTTTLLAAGYSQSFNDKCLFFKRRDFKFSYIYTHSDDPLHCSNCQTMVNQLLKTYVDIQYHDQATSYVGMIITRSQNQSQIFISQNGLAQRIISNSLPS